MPVVGSSRSRTSTSDPLAALEPSRAWLERFGRIDLPTPLAPGTWTTPHGGELVVQTKVGDDGSCTAAALRLRNPIAHQGLVWTTDIGFRVLAPDGLHGCISITQEALPGAHPRFDGARRVAPKVLSRLADALPNCTIPLRH